MVQFNVDHFATPLTRTTHRSASTLAGLCLEPTGNRAYGMRLLFGAERPAHGD